VQANGKLRGKLVLPRSLLGAALEEAVRNHATIREIVGDKQLRKLIVVPGKIINLVIG
jgi:leucyl-tRNA synthetase